MKKLFILSLFLVLLVSSAALPVWGAMSDEEFCDLCREGSVQQVADAIKAGANVNARSRNGEPALMRAVKGDHEAVVDLLLRSGANANAEDDMGTPALFSAINRNNARIVSLLLNAGADANAKVMGMMSILTMAAPEGSPEIISFLVNAGADVNVREMGGVTPLMMAATRNSPEAINILLDAGADVNAKNDDGTTPLMVATGNSLEVVNCLLNAGADVNARNNEGMTALDGALQMGDMAKAEALRQAQTKPLDKQKYSSVSYRTVARNPERYEGQYIRFSGKVIQVLEEGYDVTLRINQDNPDKIYSTDTWLAHYLRKQGEDRILDDDRLEVFGQCKGSVTYEAVLGHKVTVPAIDIDFYEILE